MSRYLTLVVRLADNADARLVFEQVERINGVALSASSWSHALDARDILATGIERKQMECDRLREALRCYGSHEWDCNAQRNPDSDDCTCGYTALATGGRHD